jgi:HEAT repeat protein
MDGTHIRDRHPHELVETLTHILAEIAKSDPIPLLEHLDPADPNATVYVFALGSAEPTPEVVAALARMVTCDDATVRYAAANSLVCLHTLEAAAALVPALSDAYPPVQFAAVQAVRDDPIFRVPDAIAPLRRIVADTRIKRTAPETWDQAREALDEME